MRVSAVIPALALALSLSEPLAGQSLKTYLPAATATKATSYLAAIDAANAGIKSRRAAARAEQLEAEAASLDAFVLLCAREDGDEWADAEGALTSSSAAAAFAEARAKALGAASALSSGGPSTKVSGTEELERKREESIIKLRALLKAASPGPKSAAGLERLLSERIKSLGKLFPEIIEVQAQLRKAGVSGLRISISAMANGSPELVADSLVESADEVLAAVPGASRSMESLASAFGAYSAWLGGFALAAFPGELAFSGTGDAEALSRGIAAFVSMDPGRASELVSAMERGDGREAAAAAAARRLASVWDSLDASRRRELAAACSVSNSTMTAFSSTLTSKPRADRPSAEPAPKDVLLALNKLAVAIADTEQASSLSAPDPAVLLLERPELRAAASTEPRYARLFDTCRGRIEAIYGRAAQDACAGAESLATVKKAATRALGSPPVSLVVDAIDIGAGGPAAGRSLALVAIAKDAEGRVLRLPIRADLAADAYARGFAKAAGLGVLSTKGSAAGGAQATLSRYGQRLVTAFAPTIASGRLAISTFPKGGEIDLLSQAGMEREILEGWRP